MGDLKQTPNGRTVGMLRIYFNDEQYAELTSKKAVRRHPGGKGLTMISCIVYKLSWLSIW